MKINLGSGKKPLAGYINIDIYTDDELKALPEGFEYYSGDAVQYIEALKKNTVQAVFSRHFLEHLTLHNIQTIFSKLEHALAPNSLVHIIVPHWANPFYYSDPSHQTVFGLYTIQYLTNHIYFRRKIPSYLRVSNLVITSVRYNFKHRKPLRLLLAPLVSLLNSSVALQELFEANLARFFPPYEIEVILISQSPSN